MAGGGRTEPGSRRRTHAASAVVPLPHPSAGDRLDLARIVPSGRSLLASFLLLAVVLGGYWIALSTSVFAVERVEVQGAPPQVARQVERVAQGILGTSLLEVDAEAIEGSVRALPSVAAASVDRAFPNTLVVRVAPVRAVGVARRRDEAWLVSATNHAIRRVDPRTEQNLPGVWIPGKVAIAPGRALPESYRPVARVFAALGDIRIPGRVKAVRATEHGLVLVLHSGVEVTLGHASDLRVKVAVAAEVVPRLEPGMRYLDVSVPERPVASAYLNSQVES